MTLKRVNVSSGSAYEPIIGFSRAVRIGSIVAVGGTTAASGGKKAAVGDPAAQTRATLEVIAKALADAGASLNDVIRTRVYLVDISHWEEVGRVHGEYFGDIRLRAACSKCRVSSIRTGSWRSRQMRSCRTQRLRG